MGIKHKLIKPYTPRHNGKVERSHRKDSERFYSRHSFYDLADFNKQLKRYNEEYNKFPMRPLNWLSPNQYLANFFIAKCVTNDLQTYRQKICKNIVAKRSNRFSLPILLSKIVVIS